ncbi:hypothetical protein FIE12Z_10143 [Fusarium flagelliforme]|uniref:Secreted protein CSS2 C-terminal domain-containing protein n=1 Tax=Fusarium flagelliforme TaxID=2675880 RepID=A0A395MEQ9_9HYPO|nr:hypothetical protein FIE12Z_10143 [Fusarium flagelliforme]
MTMPWYTSHEVITSFFVPASIMAVNTIAFTSFTFTDNPFLPTINIIAGWYLINHYFEYPPDLHDKKLTKAQQKQRMLLAKVLCWVFICIGSSILLRDFYDFLGVLYHDYLNQWPHGSCYFPCDGFGGQAGPENSISYMYSSRTDWGGKDTMDIETLAKQVRDCNPANERKAIARAVINHIGKYGTELSRTQCLDLSEGGSVNGYLVIGPTEGFRYYMNCGPKFLDTIGGIGDLE